MTDTHAPNTDSHLTPMFDTGMQPTSAPGTQPHHAPIFDTGPHPEPLQPKGSEAIIRYAGEAEPEIELEPEIEPVVEIELEPEIEPVVEIQPVAEIDPAAEIQPAVEPEVEPHPSAPQAFSELDGTDTDAFLRSVTGHVPPAVVPAQPVEVPSSFQFVKRWRFALIVAGVWALSTGAGLGFYYWWYTAPHKTLPVFGILLYLTACMVASILVSMVPDRPQITALALALMAAPLASTAAAAVLHGAYYFEWIARPVIG
ncbi:MAG TPA: hypothetical protein PLH92_10220 [Mycobacterium sp.]|nr:hypothetical protein [Mycobacterium sp.]HQC77083.1 hypothetical protein [Mycobacterium sp.]